MTDDHEHESTVPPAPPRHDGWWDKLIEAVLREYQEPEEERMERGPGR